MNNKMRNITILFSVLISVALISCSANGGSTKEGNIRISPRTFLEWSENLIKNLSKKQKKLILNCFDLLKKDGVIIKRNHVTM